MQLDNALLCLQTIVVHMLRTEHIPFFQSCSSWPLLVLSIVTSAAGVVLCYIPGETLPVVLHSAQVPGELAADAVSPVCAGLNSLIHLNHPDRLLFAFLAAIVLGYCIAVQIYKVFYIMVFKKWL